MLAVSRAAARVASRIPAAAAWAGTSSLHTTAPAFVDEAAFLKAKEAITAVPSVDNMDKLQLYALYKQATTGVNTTSAPGMLDFVVSPGAVHFAGTRQHSLRFPHHRARPSGRHGPSWVT